MLSRYAIIVAGGSGIRMGSAVPKQFLELAGKAVLMHTIEAFAKFDNSLKIILVLPESHFDFWKKLCEKAHFIIAHTLVIGGETRFHSVKNGLSAISENEAIVGIHDGVRPLVSAQTLTNCYRSAAEFGNACPAITIKESIRKIDADNNLAVNRSNYMLVQTPQCFLLSQIKKAFELNYTERFTDDASVYEAAGFTVKLVEGNSENIKITGPSDLLLAEVLLKS